MESTQRNVILDPGLVRAKAYEIWQSMGCPDGVADQTWFEAERQLQSRLASSRLESSAERRGEPSSANHANARAEVRREKATKATTPSVVPSAAPTLDAARGAAVAHEAIVAHEAASAATASESPRSEPITQPPISTAVTTRKKSNARRGRR